MACDKDIKTAVGEAKGPNVMTGNEDEATNFIVDSFRKSTCLENKLIYAETQVKRSIKY